MDAYGLGEHASAPEEWTKINEELSVRARILDEGGQLARTARRGDILTLALDFYVQPGAQDRPVALECSIFFYDATGAASDYQLTSRPCYAGRMKDASEHFQPLDLDFRFTNTDRDPLGTAAVVVQVTDTAINDGIALSPTYQLQKDLRP